MKSSRTPETAKLTAKIAQQENEISWLTQAMLKIAKTVRLPADSTMKDLPKWIADHWRRNSVRKP